MKTAVDTSGIALRVAINQLHDIHRSLVVGMNLPDERLSKQCSKLLAEVYDNLSWLIATGHETLVKYIVSDIDKCNMALIHYRDVREMGRYLKATDEEEQRFARLLAAKRFWRGTLNAVLEGLEQYGPPELVIEPEPVAVPEPVFTPWVAPQ